MTNLLPVTRFERFTGEEIPGMGVVLWRYMGFQLWTTLSLGDHKTVGDITVLPTTDIVLSTMYIVWRGDNYCLLSSSSKLEPQYLRCNVVDDRRI